MTSETDKLKEIRRDIINLERYMDKSLLAVYSKVNSFIKEVENE